MATIARNIAFAQQQAMVVGILTAASLGLWVASGFRMRYPAICVSLLSFHPAWMQSAVRGDCGDGMAHSALWFTWLALLTVIMQVIYVIRVWRRPRIRPGPRNV
jgi:hypothetical protein